MKNSFLVAASLAATVPAFAADTSFNPAMSLILSGQASYFSKNPDETAGFALGESELTLSANVDQDFYGQFTLAVTPDNQTSVEEAYIQTLDLPAGLTARFGRMKSGIGYLNSQHAHTWDFVDAPLVYSELLKDSFADDGLRLTWLAPTDYFFELGSEIFRGDSFPAAGADHQGAGAYTVYGHVGGDVGISNAWQAGLSHLTTYAQDRDLIFTGKNQVNIADFVWKWAPDGNPKERNIKFQTEYLWGKEQGDDTDLGAVNIQQQGWYAQAIYQWMPRWRAGVRYDSATENASRTSAMLDYSASEFSRVRLQLNNNGGNQQLFLQYQMSLGTHGAHSF